MATSEKDLASVGRAISAGNRRLVDPDVQGVAFFFLEIIPY